MPLLSMPKPAKSPWYKQEIPMEAFRHDGSMFQLTGGARCDYVIHGDWVSESLDMPNYKGRKYPPWSYEFHGARYWGQPQARLTPVKTLDPVGYTRTEDIKRNTEKPERLTAKLPAMVTPPKPIFSDSMVVESGTGVDKRATEYNKTFASWDSAERNPHAEYNDHLNYPAREYSRYMTAPPPPPPHTAKSLEGRLHQSQTTIPLWRTKTSPIYHTGLPAHSTMRAHPGSRSPPQPWSRSRRDFGNGYMNFANISWVKT